MQCRGVVIGACASQASRVGLQLSLLPNTRKVPSPPITKMRLCHFGSDKSYNFFPESDKNS
jgi:hypothetical protein